MHRSHLITKDPSGKCSSQPPTLPLICNASQPAGHSKASSHWSTGRCWWPVVCNRHQLLSTHFSHGLATQVEMRPKAPATWEAVPYASYSTDKTRRAEMPFKVLLRHAIGMPCRSEGSRGVPVMWPYSMSGPLG